MTNSIEFWTGKNPVDMSSTIKVDGTTKVKKVAVVKDGLRIMTLETYKLDKLVATTTMEYMPGTPYMTFETKLAGGKRNAPRGDRRGRKGIRGAGHLRGAGAQRCDNSGILRRPGHSGKEPERGPEKENVKRRRDRDPGGASRSLLRSAGHQGVGLTDDDTGPPVDPGSSRPLRLHPSVTTDQIASI